MAGLVIWYEMNVPIYRAINVIIVAQLSAAFLYFIRTKPEKTGRIFWVGVGVFVIGGVLWLALQAFMKVTGFRLQLLGLTGNTGEDLFVLISWIAFWVFGGFVGDWIGKKLGYRVVLYQSGF